jgi:hypothetical protein
MSDIAGKMAEWRKTVWGTGPCQDSSQENFTLTDEEREFLQALRDAYQEMANQTGSVNAAVQADSRKNAAIIRGLLERTK